jgi:hypothetical protein
LGSFPDLKVFWGSFQETEEYRIIVESRHEYKIVKMGDKTVATGTVQSTKVVPLAPDPDSDATFVAVCEESSTKNHRESVRQFSS